MDEMDGMDGMDGMDETDERAILVRPIGPSARYAVTVVPSSFVSANPWKSSM